MTRDLLSGIGLSLLVTSNWLFHYDGVLLLYILVGGSILLQSCLVAAVKAPWGRRP